MFWSPAVTTLSVCAAAGSGSARGERRGGDRDGMDESHESHLRVDPPSASCVCGGCGCAGNNSSAARGTTTRGGRAFGDPLRRMHPDSASADADAIAIALPDVERLRDDARQRHVSAGSSLAAPAEPRRVAAEVRAHRRARSTAVAGGASVPSARSVRVEPRCPRP